jgi:hypothetical protein
MDFLNVVVVHIKAFPLKIQPSTPLECLRLANHCVGGAHAARLSDFVEKVDPVRKRAFIRGNIEPGKSINYPRFRLS